ncbi:tRNA pseudouridine(38-40) synthase TruA [Agriterribacter sp.]|uniref:tRNA pseudouridine(38-40) synthase TruA n=1 Tax=Agriterribacter sp. TaxID=2821509 RepID=UPI002CCE3724|nr:tRNA pseudouridine(38-40) synthase TruA [Agriterribacter sp.]HRO46402.1 tRNA pseudouridine(38-40) synthase TruA [Agriterribacter sp.]HRQ17590.1 tRNA pseudouridine(38-40) synthase TruA [Agriterribacter sp.]
MQRYFIEVAYKGAGYAGFQIQENAVTIQSEIRQAMAVLFRQDILLTGSSRTDAGVNALQNFFHFNFDRPIPERYIYNLNAILPAAIVIKRIIPVHAHAHCRFDAISREYSYHVYKNKNPFLYNQAYYFPYTIDFDLLQQAASAIMEHTDFTSFSKRNTQVKNFICRITESRWSREADHMIYHVKANRFLRGMVRGLVGTMLQAGRGKISIESFHTIIAGRDCTKVNFAVPGHGLFLEKVNYPSHYFMQSS